MIFNDPKKLYNKIYKNYFNNRPKAPNDVTEVPTVLELLGNMKNKRILDMGCGFGAHAKEFIKRGAIVTAFDASDKMIDLAKQYVKGPNFFVANFEEVKFDKASFDIVNASLCLMYSNKLEPLFEDIYDWLKPNGIFIFSISHPAWYMRHVEKFNFVKPQKLHLKLSTYDVEVYHYYKPLEYYFHLLHENNFEIVHYKETVIPSKYKGWEEYKYRIPNTSIFEAKKRV
jgi:SAM-dependent methyltransferase